ncbi:MAG: alpha-amylase family glycosyl hydrolase [Bacteroidota bacterium]|nr:alpha-amylase family glycosyl hydrolase [Bacteroidota bacterium]
MNKLTLITILALFVTSYLLSQSQDSATITFRAYKPAVPIVYVPGEFNNWGPNSSGVISPGAPSTMRYDTSLSAWIKTYTFKIHDPSDTRRTMGDSVFQYKFNQGGTSTGWYSDPLNPETNPSDHNNSVLRLTKLFWFEFYAAESSQSIVKVSASLVHANNDTIVSIKLSTGQYQNSTLTTIDVTSAYDSVTRILDYRLALPIPKSYFIKFVGFNNHGDSVVFKRGGYNVTIMPLPAYANNGITLPSSSSNDSTTFRLKVPGKEYVLLRLAPVGTNPATVEPLVMRKAPTTNDWWINLKLPIGTYEYLYEFENNKMIYDPFGGWNGQYGSRFSTDSTGLTADDYVWQNTNYQRPPLNKIVIYELNLGEFAGGYFNLPAGAATFIHLIQTLPYLDSLGINAIELMPITDYGELGRSGFSWGYDVNSWFSIEPSYGTPADFKAFVDSAHGRGIAVILDVVFNHLNETSPLWQLLPDEVANPYFKFCNDLRYNEDPLCFFKDIDHWTTETQEIVYTSLKMWIDVYHVDGFRYDYTQGIGWNINDTTKGILGWVNKINRDYNGTIYQIVEHLPESPALIYYSRITSGWHDSFRDEVFNCLIPSLYPTLATIEDKVIDLGAYPSNDVPSTPARYANRTEPVNANVNHDEQSLIFEMVTYQGVPETTAIKRDKLYATFMFTSLGIPMLWEGMEFSEPRGWHDGGERLSYRPVQFSYYRTARGQSHYNYYKRLIFQRLNNPALYNGTLRKLYKYNTEKVLVWGFDDSTSGSKVMAVANLSNTQKTVRNVPWLGTGDWFDIFSQTIYTASSLTIDSITLPAYTAIVYSNRPDSVLDIKVISEGITKEFYLSQNYPNPFNPITNFEFRISEFGIVSLKVYNLLGQEVATLVNEHMQPGSYKVSWDASQIPSGVYFYRLSVGSISGQLGSSSTILGQPYDETKKLLLIR